MRNKKLVFLIIGTFIIFSLSSYAATKKLKRIGRYTLCQCKGEIPTPEVMRNIVERYAGDIKYGFDLVGYGYLFIPFIEQIKTAAFTEKALPIGEKMIWMLYRSQGKVKVVEDLEWAGKSPLEVFSFLVKKDYKNYEFIMPKPCGNVSLLRVEEFIPDAICDIKVAPAKANVNDPISVDMSGSQHVKSMEVEVIDSAGNIVATKALTPGSPKWQTSFNKPGEYMFKGKASNPEGKPSTNPCEAKVYINFPPTCEMWTSCLPCKDYVGRPITFDGSGSTDPDGEVVKAVFEIIDEAGNVVDKNVVEQKPFTWEKVFEKPGVYTSTLIVTDDFGAVSEPCRLSIEVTQKRFFMLIDGGLLVARGSYGQYIAARAGILYKIIPDTLSFIISGGGGIALKGDPWKHIFLANAILNVHAKPLFFGGGFGFSSKVREEREADAELIGTVGFDLFDNFISAGSLFGEVRVPVGEGREFSKHHKLIFGLRFIF
ncbi:MAG: PKD domain-containing protein [Candidatus Aminicenantaceae bacterium]